ncbi:hypothetical protein ALC60_03474 [Trachymyrmex zeteki]|uniref:Uncharacterized protein n=1 Tax=Mycetomoellerius zeteki TaxID=64791 RepID=A0A151XAV6_9HYME|nr:hypothetical protein ALC60_03474 [Trachymyrmex zeteki]
MSHAVANFLIKSLRHWKYNGLLGRSGREEYHLRNGVRVPYRGTVTYVAVTRTRHSISMRDPSPRFGRDSVGTVTCILAGTRSTRRSFNLRRCPGDTSPTPLSHTTIKFWHPNAVRTGWD